MVVVQSLWVGDRLSRMEREEKRRERKMKRGAKRKMEMERERIAANLQRNINLGIITQQIPFTNGNGRQSLTENQSYDPMLEIGKKLRNEENLKAKAWEEQRQEIWYKNAKRAG